jgi:hypothetical protein
MFQSSAANITILSDIHTNSLANHLMHLLQVKQISHAWTDTPIEAVLRLRAMNLALISAIDGNIYQAVG